MCVYLCICAASLLSFIFTHFSRTFFPQVFGHDTTSHNLTISNNNFIYSGCMQLRDDRCSIAVMCPNGGIPDGVIGNNNFITCPGIPPIYANPQVPGCIGKMQMVNNTINTTTFVDEPKISFSPPGPDDPSLTVVIPVLSTTTTPNAVIRYTLDGSRPTETSDIVPSDGVKLTWPGPNIAVNVRAFAPGMLPSITNGVIVERNVYRSNSASASPRHSLFETVAIINNVTNVQGWACDVSLDGGGVPPVTVDLRIDGVSYTKMQPTGSRPDLVSAKVCPNADHGFSIPIPFLKGKHLVDVWFVSADGQVDAQRLEGSPKCACDGVECVC